MRAMSADSDGQQADGTARLSGLRWAPTLTTLAFIVPVGLLYWQLGGPAALLTDPNTGVHIRTGEWILAHQAIPRQDLFSFTIADRAWLDWEWLSDAVYALLHRCNGLAAIATFSLGLLGGTAVAIYSTARLHAGRLVSFAVTCLAMAVTTIHWLARPHLFSWLLLAVFCWMLEKTRSSGERQWLLGLPFLMVLWVNLHPGFVVGLAVLWTWLFEETAGAAVEGQQERRQERQRRARWLAVAAVACLAAPFANPYGIDLHQHIASYLFSPAGVTGHVVEWLSPDFHNPRLHWFELLIPLYAAAGLWHGVRGRWVWCVLTLGSLHMALASVRNVPICAIVSAAPVATLIDQFLKHSSWSSALETSEQVLTASVSRARRIGISAIVVVMALGLVWETPAGLGPPASLPRNALNYLPDGRLFTTDRWADYLIYVQPGRRVFFDCRNDLYGTEFIRGYITVMQAQRGWEEILRNYGITVVLVPQGSAIQAALAASGTWSLSYEDQTAGVFLRAKL